MENCHEYLQLSRYVDQTPEAWRLALDATRASSDLWLAARAVMALVLRGSSATPRRHDQSTRGRARCSRSGTACVRTSPTS